MPAGRGEGQVTRIVLTRLTVAAVSFVAVPTALALPARHAQAGPEYGIIVAGMSGALHGSAQLSTCSGPDLTGAVEAIGGPDAVRELGLKLVSHALGAARPWPTNRRAFTYQGRRWVPDFVKGNTFYLVDTSPPLDLAEIRDLEAIARSRGGQLVVVTRKKAVITPMLRKALSQWWKRRAGRVSVARCI